MRYIIIIIKSKETIYFLCPFFLAETLFTSKWNFHFFGDVQIWVFLLFLKLIIKTFALFAKRTLFIVLFQLFLGRDCLKPSIFLLIETLCCLMIDCLIHFTTFRKEASHWSLMGLCGNISFISSPSCSATSSFVDIIIKCYHIFVLFFLNRIEILGWIDCFMCGFVSYIRFLWRQIVIILLSHVFTLGLHFMYLRFFLLEHVLEFAYILCKFKFLLMKLIFDFDHLKMYQIKVMLKLV